MGIEICAVGGYNAIGRNMTAVKVDDEVIIIDMGIHLENYIRYTEEEGEDIRKLTARALVKVNAIPDTSVIDDWKSKVKAIIPTHAHLDHIGAIPFLAKQYKAPVIGTPFTIAVLNTIFKDEKIPLKNPLRIVNVNSKIKISENITVEFINMTHSTPQTVMVAIHTKYGILIYANDFKFDNFPTLGQKPNYAKLEELGKKGVVGLIVDSTYADHAMKTPSESVAKEMLRDVLLGTDSKGKAVFVTTFSSHIARLKSIVELGKKMNRKIVFLGRSLSKYVEAAQEVGIINFEGQIERFKFSKQVRRKLRSISPKERKNCLFVITGHQGEPKAILSRLVDNKLPMNLEKGDHVIFSCKTIPTPTNFKYREYLENNLKNLGVRIFKDIHVSGHAAREDLRDLIHLVAPKYIFPAHGEPHMTKAMKDLAIDIGYEPNKVPLLNNGKRIRIK